MQRTPQTRPAARPDTPQDAELNREGKKDEAAKLHREMVQETSRIWPHSMP